MKGFLYNAWNHMVYVMFLGLALLIRILPGFLSYRLGKALGLLAFYILKERRELTIDNIQKAEGMPRGDEAVRMAKVCFMNLGIMGIEFLRFGWMPQEKRRKMFRFHGMENLEKAFDKKKGVMLFGLHMGNWELLGAMLALKGLPLHPIVQRQSNKSFERLINRYRERMGMRIIHKGFSLRYILRAFEQNEVVSFIMDQNAGRDGIMVDFFGRPAKTARGVAAIQEICDPPIIPLYIIRRDFEKHDIYIEPPFLLNRDQSLSKEERILENTRLLNKKAEEIIRKCPEQWLWMHKRWRD